jgi:hypothetical protein
MAASLAETRKWVRKRCERLLYRVGGLPVAASALVFGESSTAAGSLRGAYAANYWNPEDFKDLAELVTAGFIWPICLVAAALWFTWKNGAVIRQQYGKSRLSQVFEEFGAYFSAGVLPPWYYAFELYDGRSSARSFLNRFETKKGYYDILARRRGSNSPLGNKLEFARRCRIYQVPTVPILAVAADGEVTCFETDGLPPADLFVKPISGRGGRGAERWDHVGEGCYRGPGAQVFDQSGLLERLRRESRDHPRIVQPRLVNCAELGDLNNGALSTVRVLTCLNEEGWPEIVAAAMRMAIGDNHRVDNFHAGGIASAVDLGSGELGPASDMGMKAGRGWLDRHPDSGGRIARRRLPQWEDTRRLAEFAHRAFDDRVLIGWDIAATPEGPVVVEGNGGPDLDIIQRTARSGLADGRLGQLLLHHISAEAQAAVSIPSSPSLR